MASLCKVYSGQINPKPSELVLDVKPGQLQDFEAAFGQAQTILSSMKGYISHQLLKCLGKLTRYVLLVNTKDAEIVFAAILGRKQGIREL